MPRRKRPHARMIPLFCPACGTESDETDRDDHRGLCAQCGETLVPQGYCPVCERRWLLAVGATCPKHEVVLEAEPERPGGVIDTDKFVSWVTVKVYPTSVEAAISRSRLEAEGIATFLDGERSASTGMHAAAIEGVKLRVPAECAHEARIILDQDWSLPVDETGEFEDLL